MSGLRSRTKGHNFERKIAALLRKHFPNVRRGQQADSAHHPPDVDGTPYYIECKKHKRCNIQAAYEQAREGSMLEHHKTKSSIRPPVAITQDDNGHILVTMTFPIFDDFLTAYYGTQTESDD